MTAVKQANQAAGGASQEARQYLTFMLQGEMFAIGILHIKEIIEYGTLTTVPMMPPFIRGVINLRGAVVPVVDLAARFGRPASTINPRSCIVILELRVADRTRVVGVVVDAVNAVLEIGDGDIEPPPAFGTNVRTEFIQGMGKLQQGFVIVLNVDGILSVEDLSLIGQTESMADGR